MSPKVKNQLSASLHPFRPETIAAIERDKVSPRCAKCKNPMSRELHDRFGHDTHICCDPHDPVGPAELAACQVRR